MITIRQPLSFSEIGRKDNQEDALYPDPSQVTIDQRVFILCDGMGGHEHGEVASQAVCQAMGHVLDHSDRPREDFEQALTAAYRALDDHDREDGGKKMGTTMTCLILDLQGAFIAHIGDSRVYHIRPASGLMFQTSDHSLVNDLLRAGELTEEEARVYPHRNIITRAMQPHQERRARAEVDRQNDIMAGDYFLLCCDGVLERLTNQRLCEILALSISDAEKLALIKAECDAGTRDNYTCWLIPIDQVYDEDAPDCSNVEDVILATQDDDGSGSEGQAPDPAPVPLNPATPCARGSIAPLLKAWMPWAISLLCLIVAACTYWRYAIHPGSEGQGTEGQIPDQVPVPLYPTIPPAGDTVRLQDDTIRLQDDTLTSTQRTSPGSTVDL